MRANRPSSTAELVCGWRALGSLMPADRRILDDPYARAFLGLRRRLSLAAAEQLPTWLLTRLFRRADQMLGGVMTFVLARHRAIDDLLSKHRDLEQVVLLGAGYDTREARLSSELGGRSLFVVDHPATLRRRRKLAGRAFDGRPRTHTIEVEVDFARQDFAERLLDTGFVSGVGSFWIWEGVSMYLEEAAVRSTLASIARLSTPGSLLVFDTWCPPARGLPRVLAHQLPSLAMDFLFSEPLRFAPRPEALRALLEEHGLKLLESIAAPELAARYTTLRRGRARSSFMFLDLAEVVHP